LSQLFATLKKHHHPHLRFLGFFSLFSLLVAITIVFMYHLIGEMSQVAIDFNLAGLRRTMGVFTAIMFLRLIASALSTLIVGQFRAKVGYCFRSNFIKYFLQKPLYGFGEMNSGESLSIFSNDLPFAIQLVSHGGMRLIADVIALVIIFAYMFSINWWLTVVFFTSYPMLIIIQMLFSIPIQKKTAKRLEARAKLSSIANDSFQNSISIAAYGLEKMMNERCLDAFDVLINAEKSRGRSHVFLVTLGIFASQVPLLVLVGFSANQVIEDYMNIAEFVAFLALSIYAGNWLSMLSKQQSAIQTAAAGAKRFNKHLGSEVEDLEIGEVLKADGKIAVSFENVDFSYSPKSDVPPILSNVTAEISVGSRVAIVGSSGSGKSTMLKMLLGICKPTAGKITLFGTDVSQISLKSLRETFAYVPQDSFLFPETICSNIAGENPNVETLERACRDAGIWGFVQGLSLGYNSMLGEFAENISGGQKQRIALARALYRDAKVILFDEATSDLDPNTELEILKTIAALPKDKTIIMVTHRASAVAFCDIIIELKKNDKIKL